jgi:hypothetical protein
MTLTIITIVIILAYGYELFQQRRYLRWLYKKVDNSFGLTQRNFNSFQEFIDNNHIEHQDIFKKMSALNNNFEVWSAFITEHEQLHKEATNGESKDD